MQHSNDMLNLVLESDSRIMRFYKETILLNFKKNSKDSNELSSRQFFILYLILYKDVKTITEISKYLSLSKANISILTSKLEDAGYVVRNKQKELDSRVATLEVTDLGMKVYKKTSIRVEKLLVERIQKYEDGFPGFTNLLYDFRKALLLDDTIEEPEAIMLLGFIKLESLYEDINNRILSDINVKISIAEIKIIKILAELENVNFEVLTHYSALSYSTLSLQVKSLVERGFVTKIKSQDDARITYLKLTELGKSVEVFYNDKKGEALADFLLGYTEEEIVFAAKTFSILFKAMDTVEPA